MDDERFDGLYLNVAQTTRGIEPLLDTVFSFLRRKTDFFAGPPGSGENGTDKAIEKVNEVLLKHADVWRKSQKGSTKKKPSSVSKSQSDKVAKATKSNDEGVLELGTDGKFDASSALQSQNSGASVAVSPPADSASTPVDMSLSEADSSGVAAVKDPMDTESDAPAVDEDDAEERKPPPPGNGGTVPGKYVWTQILSEVVVTVPVPDNTRGRDLNVVISKNHLKVGLASSPQTIVDADLTKSVICDDSFWTVEDGCRLVINLQKLNAMEWWDSVCQGDPKIDVRSIQPENSSLGDLDGETRKTVEKMMYDQRQKAMGKPTSDEEEKFAMFEKFKAQHPEMDFSNAKFS